MTVLTGMLRRPAAWLAVAGIAGVTGAALGNGWLTGATLVSLLIAAAPCLAMCALGLCMKGGDGRDCKTGGAGDSSVPAGRPADADSR